MSAVAANPGRLALPPVVRGAARSAAPALAAVALLTAWAVHARTRDLGAPLWIDEGISLGIAHHPLTAIPGVLRQDGSPPLFYVLLHVWTALLGSGIRAAHGLTLAFAALAVPAAYWAAASPFGRWAGVTAAAVVALDPFAGTYAVEVRMYSLLLLAGLLATGTFIRAFVLRPGATRSAVAFGAALAAVLYTHNWGLFLGAAAGLAWVGLLAAAGTGPARRAVLRSGLIGFGVALLLFAPWLPSLLDQTAHTGAPWSHAPHWHSVGRAFRRVLGGSLPETVLLLFALAGVVALLRPWEPVAARAVLATLVLALGTFVIAYAWSNLSAPAWALRYLSIVLAPAAVLIGAGLGRTGPVAAVALAVVFASSWYGVPTHASLAHKSDVGEVAARMEPHLAAGTTVFSTQPEQVPVLRYSLHRRDLRFATPLGPVPDPRVMDWRDAMARLDRPAAAHELARELAGLRPGGRLLLIQPHFANASSPWTVRIRALALAAVRTVHRDRALRTVARVAPRHGYNRSTVSGLLVERAAQAG